MAVITASPKGFSRLLELQESANQSLSTIQTILELSRTASVANLVETKKIDDDGDRLEKVEKETQEIDKQLLKTQKEMLEQMKEDAKARAENASDIAKLAEGVTTFKSFGEKLKLGFDSFKGKFSADSLRKSFLSATNVAGINNKRIAREDFIQQQRSLGVEGSREELKQKFAGAQSAAKQLQSNEAELDKLKKTTGLNEEQLSKTPRGKELLQKREQASSEYSKFDVRAGLVASNQQQAPMTNLQPQTPSTAFQNAGEQQEAQIENARLMDEQTDLLLKIEQNTRGEAPTQKASSASGSEGGGLLGGIGGALKSLGGGLGSLGRGVGRGIQGLLFGLAKGLAAIANPMTLVGLGAVTLAVMGIGKALEMAAPGIEAFGEAAEKIIGGIFEGITEIIDAVTSSIERLSSIDGSNLLSVGAGLLAVSGGLAAFAAANVTGGLGNLVTGFLSFVSGQKTPIEQLEHIAKFGGDLEKAGTGVERLGKGLTAFSSIDADKIKAIAALPTEKIAAMGAAMGSATTVENKSAQNRQLELGSNKQSSNTSVVAPTLNNVNNQTNVIKPNIRNQESSWSRYQASRYAFNNF